MQMVEPVWELSNSPKTVCARRRVLGWSTTDKKTLTFYKTNNKKRWKIKTSLQCATSSSQAQSLSDELFVIFTGGPGVYNPCSILGAMETLVQHDQSHNQSQHDHTQDTGDCSNNGQRTHRLSL